MGFLGIALIIFLMAFWFFAFTMGAGLLCLGLSIFFTSKYKRQRKEALAAGLPLQKTAKRTAIFTGILAGMVAVLYLLLAVAFCRGRAVLEERGYFDDYTNAALTELPADRENVLCL